jgi:hypothetical protein
MTAEKNNTNTNNINATKPMIFISCFKLPFAKYSLAYLKPAFKNPRSAYERKIIEETQIE